MSGLFRCIKTTGLVFLIQFDNQIPKNLTTVFLRKKKDTKLQNGKNWKIYKNWQTFPNDLQSFSNIPECISNNLEKSIQDSWTIKR